MPDAVSSLLRTSLPGESVVGPAHPTLQMKKLRLRENKAHQSHVISDWQSWILYLHSSHALSPLLVCAWTNGCVCVCVCDGVISARRLSGSHLPLQVKRMFCFMFAEHGVCEDSE